MGLIVKSDVPTEFDDNSTKNNPHPRQISNSV